MKKTFLLLLVLVANFCIAQIHQSAIFLDETQLALGPSTTLISDATANNGTCMFKGIQTADGTLWYGPYSHFKAGNYLVQFRIKVSSIAPTGDLFQVDVSSLTAGGLAAVKIRSNMFRAANEWQLISMPVKIPDGINNIEIRGIEFKGLTDVYFDYVQIVPAQHTGIISDEFTILGNGNLGIATTNPTEKLSVNGKIRAHEIKVETANWPDYVFEDDYKLMSLVELEKYVVQHKHLPEIPTANDAEKNGIDLGEMNKLLLKKVEELTLHLIDMSNENKNLKKTIELNKDLEKRVASTEKQLAELKLIFTKKINFERPF